MLVNDSDNHKPNCGFAEETVAYLYGETDETQNAKLRAHLQSCSSCAKELSAFSSIHSSIQNWKAAEFDALSSPEIKIPYDSRQTANEKVPGSWLTDLRQKFALTNGWIPAGAFAAVLIGLAFGLYFISFADSPELASERKHNQAPVETLSVSENKKVEIAETQPDPKSDDELDNSELLNVNDSPAFKETEKSVSPNVASAPERIATKRKTAVVKENLSKQQPSKNKTKATESYADATPGNNRHLPKLNNLPEEADEEDLRLADLLDEIDEGK